MSIGDFRSLDPARIVATAEALARRIAERFPESGLSRIGAELHAVSREATKLADWLAKPNLPLRIAIGLTMLLMVGLAASGFALLHWSQQTTTLSDLMQGIEAAINNTVLLGLAIFFFATLEARHKRHRALKALHVLRSLAHIVDMHQLTKDPERLAEKPREETASSPPRELTAFQLVRYLDYCSELLSIISKVGALYVQRFDDAGTLNAVNEIEELTAGLSRKIWQKIMILDRIENAARSTATVA